MSQTNAERQAAWRARRQQQLDRMKAREAFSWADAVARCLIILENGESLKSDKTRARLFLIDMADSMDAIAAQLTPRDLIGEQEPLAVQNFDPPSCDNPATSRTRERFTEAQVRQIRKEHARGMTIYALAAVNNCSTGTIHNIVHRKTWKNV